ncbi:MAG: glycoside hydrolase family 3 C-terminal domain-containing protein [Polyangiaceae bacterium]|nr:glycoside hydrolase family 3 C-terminal domain-containing protein [Polyangiaceae bacterium]
MRSRVIEREMCVFSSGVILLTALGCAGELVVSDGGTGADGAQTGGAENGGSGAVAAGAVGGTGGAGSTGWEEAGETGVDHGAGGETSIEAGCGTGPLELEVNDHDMVPGYDEPADPMVDLLLEQMTLEQKIAQMQGVPRTEPPNYEDIERSVDVMSVAGHDLRGYRYRDGVKGVNLDAGQDNRLLDDQNYSTHFPAPSLRAASWDLDLEWRVGFAMGDETAASRNSMLIAPCVNVVRHPYWGRAQEAYGEDSHHIGRMASAFTAGLQQHVIGCASHFAANNIERGRTNQDAIMAEQTLREIYGRHFEMVVRDGGIGCVMASYNKINGVKSTQNAHLLTTILRDPYEQGGMGFRGLVLSDWWAMPGDQMPMDAPTTLALAAEAARAGLDIELPWTLRYGSLAAAAAADPSLASSIDASARRVLEQKLRFGTAYMTDPWGKLTPTTRLDGSSIAGNEAHLDLAEETAKKSAVLLRNGHPGAPVLPLGKPASIAVIGAALPFSIIASLPPTSADGILRLATEVSLGDRGSSRVNADPAQSVGPFAGIQAVAAHHDVGAVTTGTTAADAASAEVVVVIVGLTPGDEGEEYAIPAGGDRTTLELPGGQNQLVNDVLALDKPTIIVIESGSIVDLPWLSHANQNQATVWLGYAGQRAGAALAKLLFGEANFSGKMPMAWPLESELPVFTMQEDRTEMGYYIGYRWYDRRDATGTPPNLVFPFGWGMSYTTFAYSNLELPCADVAEDGVIYATVDITNTGTVDGEEIPMLFVAGPPKPANITGERSVKELKSFAKVAVPAGATVTVTLPVRVQDLRHWEGNVDGRWVIDSGEYTFMVGPNAAPEELALSGVVTIHP